MSHFSLLMVVPKDEINFIYSYIETILAPYSENLEVEPFISSKKEEVKKKFEEIKKLVNETESDKLPNYLRHYKKENINKMTIREFWKSYAGEELDEEGNSLTTYNPNSKWDWYEVGGRWDTFFKKAGTIDNKIQIKVLLNLTNKEFINFVPFAFVNLNGKWFERGKMGWFGESYNNKDSWTEDFKKLLLKENPKNYLVIVDCHI